MARFTLNDFLRLRFDTRVHKVPLDPGGGCPNREEGRGGCVFCSPGGAGTRQWERGLGLSQQWEALLPKLAARFKAKVFLAYLQSYSTTHRSAADLRRLLDETLELPGCQGLVVGTRPDCLDDEKADILAEAIGRAGEGWVELGLQSANPRTLHRILRGHEPMHLLEAVRALGKRGVKTCVHVMAGLPGENEDDFLHTVRFAAASGAWGIKFHQTCVLQGSRLAQLWRQGSFTPWDLPRYAACLARALELLPPEMVIHRLWADFPRAELLAPVWASDRMLIKAAVEEAVEARRKQASGS